MRKIEAFIPEEGDRLILIEDLPDLELSIGDIVTYVNIITMGAICKKIDSSTQIIIPARALKGIHCGKMVDLTFQ